MRRLRNFTIAWTIIPLSWQWVLHVQCTCTSSAFSPKAMYDRRCSERVWFGWSLWSNHRFLDIWSRYAYNKKKIYYAFTGRLDFLCSCTHIYVHVLWWWSHLSHLYILAGAIGCGHAWPSRVPGAPGAVRHLHRATVSIGDSRRTCMYLGCVHVYMYTCIRVYVQWCRCTLVLYIIVVKVNLILQII